MAMLLIDITPNAELIIGRVAEDTTKLDGMEDAISQLSRFHTGGNSSQVPLQYFEVRS